MIAPSVATRIDQTLKPVAPIPPRSLAMNPPMEAPAIPMRTVKMKPPGPVPGMIHLASNPAMSPTTIQEMRALEDSVSAAFVRKFHENMIHHPVLGEVLSTALSKTLNVLARVWRDYHEGEALNVDDRARLGKIGAPTLILWGERDAVLGHEEQKWHSAVIPDATLKGYSGRGMRWPLSDRSGSSGIRGSS
jgi:pimeloyl-ACP methyl ester carboxylesterase